MSSTEHLSKHHLSNIQSFDQAYLTFGDPTSLECDKNLEYLREDQGSSEPTHSTSTPSSASTAPEVIRTNHKCGRSFRLRSRSEGSQRSRSKNYFGEESQTYSKQHSLADNSDPWKSSCCSQSFSDSNSCLSTALSYCSLGDKCLVLGTLKSNLLDIKNKPYKSQQICGGNKFCTRTLGSPSFVDCSSLHPPDIELVSVPPPMALLNVDRLSIPNLANQSSCVNTRINCPEIPLNNSTADEAILPSCDFSMTSSGTSSLLSAMVTMEDSVSTHVIANNPTSMNPANDYGSMIFGPVDAASARDSGLSSHSSNSTNQNNSRFQPLTQDAKESTISSVETVNTTPAELVGQSVLQPPPVPPHASKSQAYTARISRIHRTFINGSNVPETSLGKHLTYSTEGTLNKKIPTEFEPHAEYHFPVKYNLKFDHKCQNVNAVNSSPIWKRKYSPLINALNRNSNTDNKGLKPNVTVRTSSTTDHWSTLPKSNFTTNGARCLISHQLDPTNALSCLICNLNWEFYLLQPPHFHNILNKSQCRPLLKQSQEKRNIFLNSWHKLINQDHCPNCSKHLFAVGVNLFNRNPIKGLKFLHKYNFLNSTSTESVSEFILQSSDLCRSKVGVFLGLPNYPNLANPSAVAQKLFQSLDFSGLEVDEALRLVIYHFGLPVESQEIDRLLQCLSDYYYTIRWSDSYFRTKQLMKDPTITEPPISKDQLLLLFYAVLLLQTSLHNVNAAKSKMGKQTLGQFVKYVQDFLFPTSEMSSDMDQPSEGVLKLRKQIFSQTILAGIYNRIRLQPLEPGPDHTTLVRRIHKSILNLNDGQFNTPKEVMPDDPLTFNSIFDLVESHRRLVCYCAVIHINHERSTATSIAVFRHFFLFNDLIILAKDFTTSSLKNKLTAKDTFFSKTQLSPVHNNNNTNNDHFDYLHPPWDLFLMHSNGSDHSNYINNFVNSSVTCLPIHSSKSKPRSRSKVERADRVVGPYKSDGIQNSCRTRLHVTHMISLKQCHVRPFRTNIYQFGFEIYTYSDPISTNQKSINRRNSVILAVLTKMDYDNLLKDIVNSLRETTRVTYELCA